MRLPPLTHYRPWRVRFAALPWAAALCCVMVTPTNALAADGPSRAELGSAYLAQIRPLIESYCIDCHSADLAEGDVDLASLSTWDQAASQPETWQKVAVMLGNGLMPPDGATQPSADERAALEHWVRDYLAQEAQARAGDPGRVILRRLSNAEYTNTIRDLTHVDSLDPAREFPADGAAGEGFTNTGAALVMSPELITKYLDAAKEIASHAVLLPDGFRFSPHASTRDWTDEILAQIRAFYGEFTEASGGSQVNLQGIVFETNQGGKLPVEKYLAATLAERDALQAGQKTIDEVAHDHRLNAKYLGILWANLTCAQPSLLLKDFCARWRKAKPADAPALAADVAAWQQALFSFSSVGLLGREGGPKRWMEPVDLLSARQELRYKLPDSPESDEVVVSLIAADAGDGNEGDVVVWQAPRLVSLGRPDLLLRDVRGEAENLQRRRAQLFSHAAACLNAADELSSSADMPDLSKLAAKHGVAQAVLRAWLDYLGISTGEPAPVEGLLTEPLTALGNHQFVNGWGSAATPLVAANSSDQAVRIPGTVKAHGVVVHPSPSLRAVVGWRSPISATVRIEATVGHAHPECGNGVTWALDVRRGASRQRLAEGVAQGAASATAGPVEAVVRSGDVVALSIAPRDGHHACDLTAVDLKIGEDGDGGRTWNLADDVADDVLAGNPHADRFGSAGVWNFYAAPEADFAAGPTIPPGSVLAKWLAATSGDERRALAAEVQKLLTNGPPAAKDTPDGALYRQLASLRGPLLGVVQDSNAPPSNATAPDAAAGVDPALFGHRPDGSTIDSADLCVHAPSAIVIRLPADLAAGCELVTSAVLDPETGREGSVQLSIVAGSPALQSGLVQGANTVSADAGANWSGAKRVTNSAPILITDGSDAQRRMRQTLEDFRQLFPPALCYTKIVPVDEVISTTLFYREDDHLVLLMLNDAQRQRLDRLWDELHFVSRDALTSVDAYEQLMEFATQDADPKIFEPLRQPVYDRAAAFRQRLVDCEPVQLDALITFADRAYRRPLATEEADELRELYAQLRQEGLPHEEAFRLTLARILVSPAFLYHVEKPFTGAGQGPVTNWELASRLSYFLWASQPDDELRAAAARGQLHEPEQLSAQTKRMLADPKTRRLATEFACHWLQINGFENLDEKSEQHFPTFASLRSAMAEESIQFFTDLFHRNGSVLGILDADYTFLNEDLARHYGIPGVTGPQWRRVDGVRKFSRGGVLAQAVTLAKHSGASRTSPILRGIWISEVLLGERLPKPPPGVPPLPEDETATDGLTVRQLVEKHVSDPACAMCHRRIDPYGFSLEAFDAIGRLREKDLGDRPIDTRVRAPDGAEFDGLKGLRNYLLTQRRDAFTRQFCRKLLGYALARTVQLSDDPLLDEMQRNLAANGYKVAAAVETIVLSRQFREIRSAGIAFDQQAPVPPPDVTSN